MVLERLYKQVEQKRGLEFKQEQYSEENKEQIKEWTHNFNSLDQKYWTLDKHPHINNFIIYIVTKDYCENFFLWEHKATQVQQPLDSESPFLNTYHLPSRNGGQVLSPTLKI